jgi:hypothetical protein
MPILEIWQRDAPSICVRVTPTEWEKLIAPAREYGFPVDGSTVDTEFLADLMERPVVTGKPKLSVELV